MRRPASGGDHETALLWALRIVCSPQARTIHPTTFWRLLGVLDFDEALAGVKGLQRGRAFARRQLRKREATARALGGSTVETVAALADVFQLTPVERSVLLFTAVASRDEILWDVLESLGPSAPSDVAALVACAMTLDAADVEHALRADGALRAAELVERGDGEAWIVRLSEAVSDLVGRTRRGKEPVLKHLLPESPAPRCTVADFAHLDADLALVIEYLESALTEHRRGVAVLFHGASGTGKTELARAIAAHLGAKAYDVRFDDAEGDAIAGAQRLASMKMMHVLLERVPRSVVLFDEAEDVFPTQMGPFGALGPQSARTKAFTNRAIETATVPTIWTSNDIEQIDPAVLRRFDYVLELRRPPRPVRRRLLEAGLAGLPVRSEWFSRTAARSDLSAADIERAARVVRSLAARDPEALEAALDRVLAHAVGKGAPPAVGDDAGLRYDVSLVDASVSLTSIVDGLRVRPRGTYLFHGAPGTGKTAFARHIAEALDRPLHAKTGSDLLSCWLGGTEKNIAAAFAAARDDGAVLLLDETDSLLRPRTDAVRSWEVTQVNELLVRLERFDGVVICATNALDGIDPAAVRRFAVKVKFAPPGRDARWVLFGAALDSLGVKGEGEGPRAWLDLLDGLTPGDFAAVVRNARATGAKADGDWVIARLGEELAMKPDARRRAGFG